MSRTRSPRFRFRSAMPPQSGSSGLVARCVATRLAVVVVCAVAFLGCPRVQVEDDGAPALGPGSLLPADAIPYDFAWQQVVTIAWDGRDESFDAVLQKRGDVVELIGLGPMGRPAFVITHGADGVLMENLAGRELPFEPAYMIADVQKVSYPWGEPVVDGSTETRTLDVAEFTVEETWTDGHLTARTFARADAPDRGVATVRYEGWGDGDAPATATFDNAWFGYVLRVRTVEQQRLP